MVLVMAKFTDIEKHLMGCVTDDRLRTSLAMIRQAAENIWAIDAPRIVQDYTEHGINHCERLIDFANKLLIANDGKNLSVQEMYLLLAGIYLHDIGMQCDVVKFLEIKELAEKYGARFEIEFTSRVASEYSIEEQKQIRQNHQYLTAAWIDHANRTGETLLGQAAKTIPVDLVDELMDVCKYHSKLPINDCPHTFKFDSNGRKQLVASLLRFADELDVNSNRVSIETVKNFSIDPRNGIYWWLHNNTQVIFSARNVITLTIRLHPIDANKYGSFVHTTFITEFQIKNRPVLSVLARDGIPIVIGDDSKVIEHDRTEKLPQDIIQLLQLLQQKRSPLLELAQEVRTWLQAIRYEVSDPQKRDDRTMDMVATLEQGTVKQRVFVRCIGGQITFKDVESLNKTLDRRIPQGWLISDTRISENARNMAAELEFIGVFNLSDFLQQMVWGPYFNALKASVEKNRIPDLYVDLACYKQEVDEKGREINRERYNSLDTYIDEWLKERGKMHISLLGEFGTGKTWFCRHYAYIQLNRYLKNPAKERLPLLITLRTFTKTLTAQQLINDALLEQYKLPFVGSAFEVFQEMNRLGKLLLILDGFDEMARQVDYQTVVNNFWELAKLVDENSKVILTSRTEYFRWAKESEKVLGGEEFGQHTIILSPPKFEVLHLNPFTDDQIIEVITLLLGKKKGPIVAGRILKTENLAEMVRKPVLIELLLAVLEEVNIDVLKSQAKVYLYATNKLLMRNICTKRTFTRTADKLFFLCELAWEMIREGTLRIHYIDIPERIKSYFGPRIEDKHKLDNWDFDLRNQTLLHRDAAGYYEFAHKSLAEYFVAFKFAAELGYLAPEFKDAYCEIENQPREIPISQKDIIRLAETFGIMSLKDNRLYAVRNFLVEMLANDATYLFRWDEIPGNDNKKLIDLLKQNFDVDWVKEEKIEKLNNNNTIRVFSGKKSLSLSLNDEKTKVYLKIEDFRTYEFIAKTENGVLNIYNIKNRLWDIIYETKGKIPEQVKYAGGNAATLLWLKNESFANKNLAYTVLTGAHLGENLAETNMQGAFLKEVNLKGCNLNKSNLKDAQFDPGSLIGADLRNAIGIDSRFFSFASSRIPENVSISNFDSEIDEIEKLLVDINGPSVVFIIGYTGVGKTTLMATVAQMQKNNHGRNIFWFDGGVTRLVGEQSIDFYKALATFMKVGGYGNLIELLINFPHHRSYHKSLKIFSSISPAFEKEKWLICIDDIIFDEFHDFIKFFGNRTISTKIIITCQNLKLSSIPENKFNIPVIKLHPIRGMYKLCYL